MDKCLEDPKFKKNIKLKIAILNPTEPQLTFQCRTLKNCNRFGIISQEKLVA